MCDRMFLFMIFLSAFIICSPQPSKILQQGNFWKDGVRVAVLCTSQWYMSRDMTKQTKWLCAQQRLRSAWASTQSDQSSLSAWRNLGSLATNSAHSEDSDQTGRMPRLIWVFAGRTLILLVLSCRGSYVLTTFQLCWDVASVRLLPWTTGRSISHRGSCDEPAKLFVPDSRGGGGKRARMYVLPCPGRHKINWFYLICIRSLILWTNLNMDFNFIVKHCF